MRKISNGLSFGVLAAQAFPEFCNCCQAKSPKPRALKGFWAFRRKKNSKKSNDLQARRKHRGRKRCKKSAE
jgi:hypothetical protein